METQFKVGAVLPFRVALDKIRPRLITTNEAEAVAFAQAHAGPAWPQVTITASRSDRPGNFAIRHFLDASLFVHPDDKSDTLWTLWDDNGPTARNVESLTEALAGQA